MEKLNLVFTDEFTTVKSVLWIISLLSWVLFISTGLSSIKFFHDSKYEIIWTIEKIGYKIDGKYTVQTYYPIQINTVMLYIIFLLLLLFAVAAFVMYIIKSLIRKDDDIFEGMMGIWPRLHFFPLIVVSFLFLIGQYFFPHYLNKYYIYTSFDKKKGEFIDYAAYFNRIKDLKIFALSLSIIGLISLIFIYIVTDLKTDQWYVVLTIKKGFYSSMIIILWYYFCYMLYQVTDCFHPLINEEDDIYLRNHFGIGGSLVVGVGSLIFSFFFKDIVSAFMNMIIYIGMTIYYFSIQKSTRKHYYHELADGIIDILIIVCSIGMIAFLFFKYRDVCLSSNRIKVET